EVPGSKHFDLAQRRRPGNGPALNEDRSPAYDALHGRPPGQADRRDARHMLQALGDLFVRARHLLLIRDERWWERDVECLHLRGAYEAWLDLSHDDKRLNHQARDNQQHEGERDLRHDERVSRAVTPRRIAGQSAAVLECCEVELAKSDGGKQAEE